MSLHDSITNFKDKNVVSLQENDPLPKEADKRSRLCQFWCRLCIVYQDSIGNTIFKLYAANVWGQHSPVINKIKP